MAGLFLSYRRSDAEGQAGRLYDDLKEKFGGDAVFMDVAGIEPGRDFREAIDHHVTACGALLAIIGKDWVSASNSKGQRRLDDPRDFVRLEIGSALRRGIPVIPVLVRGAAMPQLEELPDDCKDLCYRNAVELSHARWDSDVELLIEAVSRYVGSTTPLSGSNDRPTPDGDLPRPPQGRGEKSIKPRIWVMGLLLVLLALGGGVAGFHIVIHWGGDEKPEVRNPDSPQFEDAKKNLLSAETLLALANDQSVPAAAQLAPTPVPGEVPKKATDVESGKPVEQKLDSRPLEDANRNLAVQGSVVVMAEGQAGAAAALRLPKPVAGEGPQLADHGSNPDTKSNPPEENRAGQFSKWITLPTLGEFRETLPRDQSFPYDIELKCIGKGENLIRARFGPKPENAQSFRIGHFLTRASGGTLPTVEGFREFSLSRCRMPGGGELIVRVLVSP